MTRWKVAGGELLTDIIDTRMAICPYADALQARYKGNAVVTRARGVVLLNLVHGSVVHRSPLGCG